MIAGVLGAARQVPARSDLIVVAIPDTQCYSQSRLGPGANYFDIRNNWIIANCVIRGIVPATHPGDVVNVAVAPGAPRLGQWDDAVRAMNTPCTITPPAGVLPGNHD